MKFTLQRGFTLIEVMVVVAIVAILASVALPAYTDYIRRGQLPEAFTYLSDYRIKMEQYYQDNRSYASGSNCGVAVADQRFFTFVCGSLGSNGQTYTITATGKSGTRAVGYTYSIDHAGIKRTTQFASSSVSKTCWATKLSDC